MFETTRKALGVLGVTGSILASIGLPLASSNGSGGASPSILSVDAVRIEVRADELGASGRIGELPVVCTIASFVVDDRGLMERLFENDGGALSEADIAGAVCEQTNTPAPEEELEAEEQSERSVDSAGQGVFRLVRRRFEGLSLEEAAERMGLPVELLRRLNPGVPPGARRDVLELRCPEGGIDTYEVRRYDSIWKISRRRGVPMACIIVLNNLDTTILKPGQKLFIPRGRTPSDEARRLSLLPRVMKLLRPGFKAVLPAGRRITSGFGWRIHPVTHRRSFHTGIDIAAPEGSPICAWDDGVVVVSKSLPYMGRCVVLKHDNGLYSVYGHCSVLLVHRGERVRRGSMIARVGRTGRATGAHLHFAIKNGRHCLNPARFLGL